MRDVGIIGVEYKIVAAEVPREVQLVRIRFGLSDRPKKYQYYTKTLRELSDDDSQPTEWKLNTLKLPEAFPVLANLSRYCPANVWCGGRFRHWGIRVIVHIRHDESRQAPMVGDTLFGWELESGIVRL